ncbi:MAG: homoserine O-acetyltransferase [Candidatus Omnitrophica bacterium]|nr:homoserine O-acetyltransferase [Candidatus Omnitrophota bacterium]MDD5513498.1 homoserine O-acetyltransferase [Candidatus Omnitrophota bacterium]
MNKEKSLGTVETHYFTFAEPPHELILQSGQKIGPVTLAYEAYGALNKEKSNAILVLHALSGDAHAAGRHQQTGDLGWWDSMIGPGKALDTQKYFILCSNVLGGCKGSTGPAAINPKTAKPYALSFPIISIADMVKAQKALIDHLGIKKLLCVIGGSMGGMEVLQWVASYPKSIQSAIPIATCLKHSPQQIAFSEVGRQAVMADPAWDEGNYYGKAKPEKGLAVARMIGHITYMSDKSMEEKFSRKLKTKDHRFKFTADFEVEGYLHYRGDNFVKRFDANSYLYITKAMDYFDLSGGKFLHKGENESLRFLVIAFKSDWLYPLYQSQEIVRQLKLSGLDATYCEINSSYGHDAFLLEIEEQTRLVKHFLNKSFYGYDVVRGYEI